MGLGEEIFSDGWLRGNHGENISQKNGTMSQEFITVQNGVKIIHRVISDLKTGNRKETTFRVFT